MLTNTAELSTTNTDLLTEHELLNWFVGQSLPDDEEDDEDAAVALGEDRVLFVTGTLCMLNGQRALWREIFELVYHPAGSATPDEDALAWLAERTAVARVDFRLALTQRCRHRLA